MSTLIVGLLLHLLIYDASAPLPNREERASQPSIDSFMNRITSLMRSFQRFVHNNDISNDQLSQSSLGQLEEMWQTLQTAMRHFENLAHELPADLFQPVETSLQQIRRYVRTVRQIHQNNSINTVEPQQAPSSITSSTSNRVVGNRGASRYNINKEQLETLLGLRMTLSEIARSRLLGTGCRNTLYNHCRRLDVQLPRQRFMNVSDESLLNAVREVNAQQPRSGSEEVRAILRTSMGMAVQRDRVRRALSAVDPVGTACRWAQVTDRRSYSVKSPNSLWHLDNNHALKRWGFFVHGGIDGFSRTVTFLCASTSLSARTSLRFFLSGIQKWGLPSRIRLDRGSEYNECERYMVWQMGAGRGSVLRGKSVHNQRIERLWRDVYTKVLDLFYRLFYHLEDTNALNINNPIHIMALHYIFQPRIQAALTRWANAHNNHSIRTEHHRSPRQMWLSNMVQQQCRLQAEMVGTRPSVAVSNSIQFRIENHTQEIYDMFGINITESMHEVIHIPIDEADFEALNQQVNPLHPSLVYGLDLYQKVVTFLYNVLHRDREQPE